VNLFTQILKVDPDYEDTRDQLAHAETQARLTALYDTATNALDSQRWTEAVDALSEIVGVDADYGDAAELLTQAGMALSEYKTQEHLAHLYQDGLAHLESEEWLQAEDCLGQILDANPTYRDAALLLSNARRRARWAQSVLGRLSRSLNGWLHSRSEADRPEPELEPRKEP